MQYFVILDEYLKYRKQFINLFSYPGCVYGKGNQYTGKANVTISGNECLPWADERIAHQLRINVSVFINIYLKICYSSNKSTTQFLS